MGKEIEVKFTDIDKKTLRKKLQQIGAVRVHKAVLFRRYVFNLPNGASDGFARIRDEVFKKTITSKIYTKDSKYPEETEIEFTSTIEEARTLLKSFGLTQKSYQETLREKWAYQGCSEIVIDTIPGIPDYVEIECDDENTVRQVSQKLGFDFEKGKYGSFCIQFEDYYGIPCKAINSEIPQLTFENIKENLKGYILKNHELLTKVFNRQQKAYLKARKRSERLAKLDKK